MNRRKSKAGKSTKSKLYQGGVVNESQRLSIDNAITKILRAGRRFTARLVDTNDPYNLRGRY